MPWWLWGLCYLGVGLLCSMIAMAVVAVNEEEELDGDDMLTAMGACAVLTVFWPVAALAAVIGVPLLGVVLVGDKIGRRLS